MPDIEREPAIPSGDLYGKLIHLHIDGDPLIGGRVIEGPLFSVVGGETTASWICELVGARHA